MKNQKEFVEAVREMRRLQKLWFGGDKSRVTLEASKAAEKCVDALLIGQDSLFAEETPEQLDIYRLEGVGA